MLDRRRIAWWAEAGQLRRLARQQVPSLITPGRLPPGRRGVTVVARLGGAVVPWFWRRKRGQAAGRRHGRAVAATAPAPPRRSDRRSSSSARSSPRARACSRPSSSRSSSAAATRCRPSRSTSCAATVEADLGRPLDDVFESFDVAPLAAASIAQVHAARLRTGEDVVVKVQRPDVARLVHTDLRAMAWLAPHLVGRIPVAALANPPALVELFADTIVEELDFRVEAANMLDVAAMLRDLGQTGYVVPRPHSDAGHPPGARDAAPRRVQVRRRRRDARGRRRHRGGGAHGDGRPDGGGDDQRHLPRRPARRQPARARPTGAPACSTSASSAGSTTSAGWPSCG